jgi:Surface-adhesin protein E
MKKYFQLIFILFGLLIFWSGESWGGAPWKYYGTNEDGSYYYDTESLARSSKQIVRVWVQSAYTDQGISHWVRGGGEEFQNLAYTLVLTELNCADRAVRSLQIVFYSKDAEVLNPINAKEWELFAPDSMSEALYEAVCQSIAF